MYLIYAVIDPDYMGKGIFLSFWYNCMQIFKLQGIKMNYTRATSEATRMIFNKCGGSTIY